MRFKDPLQRPAKEGRWFAWRPVTTTDGYAVWLEYVERKYITGLGYEYEKQR